MNNSGWLLFEIKSPWSCLLYSPMGNSRESSLSVWVVWQIFPPKKKIFITKNNFHNLKFVHLDRLRWGLLQAPLKSLIVKNCSLISLCQNFNSMALAVWLLSSKKAIFEYYFQNLFSLKRTAFFFSKRCFFFTFLAFLFLQRSPRDFNWFERNLSDFEIEVQTPWIDLLNALW